MRLRRHWCWLGKALGSRSWHFQDFVDSGAGRDTIKVEKEMEDKAEKVKEVLDEISQPCPIDDAENICVHIVEEGNRVLVSIPED